MRTFTIAQIKAHFRGEPYSDCPEFIGQLVRYKILTKVDVNRYTYDLTKLSYEVIAEINLILRYKHLTYKRS
jgi:hypothetical protein